MRVLVIDNYDSFTYNLVQYLQIIGDDPIVYRNDQIELDELNRLSFDYILISPGPSSPAEAGISIELIKSYSNKIPIIGICLGHQAIAHAFGGTIEKARQPMHGKTMPIFHDGKTLFKNIPSPLSVTRYHSLIMSPEHIPACLEVSAMTAEGEIMGIRHRDFCMEGVQFHPESIMTERGLELMSNFQKRVIDHKKLQKGSIYA